jgi:hypothetical protein
MFKAGISKEIITPVRGIPLAGYFNPRPNTGILDDLFVRVLLFEKNETVSGLVVFDLCFLSTDLIEVIKNKLSSAGIGFGDNLIFSATHTHTGPYIDDFFGVSADAEYLEYLADKAASAIQQAFSNLAEAELLNCSVDSNPYAFNRRYWMKEGNVLTNPGFLNQNIDRPEGPVDSEIAVLAVRQDDRIAALVTNIVNHTDTIGGDFVSADWPGRMEREVQNIMGYDVPVLTLIGCSGNINHFDVSNDTDQTSYAEACRIGEGYGKIVAAAIDSLQPVEFDNITVNSCDIVIPFRDISECEVERARGVVERVGEVSSDDDMTSEGLATGDGPVAKFFAEQLIAYKQSCSGKKRSFKLVSVKFDDKLAFASLPGEPFTEIGLTIKEASPCKSNFIVSLGMGECGYVPMPECFDRGGYEILPVEGGGPREDTAGRLISEVSKLINL